MKFTVTDTDGMRLSEYLKRRLRFTSALITHVKFGGVSVNGERATMRYSVKRGDIITVEFPEEKSEGIEPVDFPLSIVYEDDHILVVDKPTDMPTHPSRGNHLTTLGNAVMGYMGKDFVFRAVSRLDRGTSGLVLIAKNPYSAALLYGMMRNREIEKIYYARCEGTPFPASGRISAPIARIEEGNIKRCVRADGKEAVTEYETISVDAEGNALLKIHLLTGRTHQIRVHLAHIGHSLLGDFLYGSGDGGYMLRCGELNFTHPITGERLSIKAKV